MKTSGLSIRRHKTRGLWAELLFMARVLELGFHPAKPGGDNTPYDIVLDVGGHFVSVQVKSTYFQASNLKPGNFVASLFHINGPNHRYEPSDFDYLAMYCIPRDIWYIIPSEVAALKHAIRVCPGDRLNQWEPYREAWHLLHDRVPAPLPKRGSFNLYGIVDESTPSQRSGWKRKPAARRVVCNRTMSP